MPEERVDQSWDRIRSVLCRLRALDVDAVAEALGRSGSPSARAITQLITAFPTMRAAAHEPGGQVVFSEPDRGAEPKAALPAPRTVE